MTHVRYKPRGNSPLCCVQHLPVRRARTEQLSPNTPVSTVHFSWCIVREIVHTIKVLYLCVHVYFLSTAIPPWCEEEI